MEHNIPDGSVIIDIDLDYSKFKQATINVEVQARESGEKIEKALTPKIDTKKPVEDLDSIVKKAVDRYEKGLSKVEDSAEKTGQKVSDSLSQPIDGQQIVDEFGKITKAATARWNELQKEFEKPVFNSDQSKDEIDFIAEYAATRFEQGFKEIEDSAEITLGDITNRVTPYIDSYSSSINESVAALEKYITKTDGAGSSTKKFGDSAEEAGQKTKKSADGVTTLQIAFGNLVAKGISLAISALKDFIKSGIEYQASLESTSRLIEHTFGETGQQHVKNWINATGDALGYAEGNAQKYIASLGLIFDNTRKTASQTAVMSTNIVEAATNWAYFTNNNPEDVLKAIEGALNGNVRTLKEYGINLTGVDSVNSKYARGLKKTNGTLSESEKIVARYNAILDLTRDATGAAMESQESYAAQTFQLRQNLDKLSGTLAKEFLPTLISILQETNDYLDENGEAIASLGVIVESVLNIFLQLIKVLTVLPPELILIIGYVILAVQAFDKVEKGVNTFGGILERFKVTIGDTTAKVIALVAAISVLLFLILSIKEGTEKASKGLNGLGDASNQAIKAAQNTSNVRRAATGTNYANRGWYEVAENGTEIMYTRDGRTMLLAQGGEAIVNSTQTANILRGSSMLAGSGGGTLNSNSSTYNDNRTINMRIDDLELFRKMAVLVDEYELSRIRGRAAGGE